MTTSQERLIKRLKDVQLILKDMLKVIKVVAMYPESNPLPQSLKRSFAERLVNLVQAYGGLKLSVNQDTLMLEDETVFSDSSKEEALASLFFTAGISCLTFAEDLDAEQVYRLLEVIKNYQNNRHTSEDLVTQIWAANLPSFSITTVEDIALSEYDGDFSVQEVVRASHPDKRTLPFGVEEVEEYDQIFERELRLEDEDTGGTKSNDTGQGAPATGSHRVLRAGPVSPAGPRASGSEPSELHERSVTASAPIEIVRFRVNEASDAMGLPEVPVSSKSRAAAPNASLILNDEFKLSEEEEQLIRELMDEDARFDIYESTIELLKEMLHQESEQADFFESVTICEKIHADFIESGRLIEAAHLLEYYRTLEDQLRPNRPALADRLKDARLTAGTRHRLKALTESLNRSPDTGAAELRRYLEHFGWEALNAITDMLGDLEHRTHRYVLCDFLVDRGKENLDFVSKGVFDKRWFVVRNTVVILGRIGDDRALAHLQKTATHEDRRVRLELGNVLKESQSDRAIDLLARLALDSDREVREQAIHSLVTRRGQKAFAAAAQIINSERFITLDRSEQQLLLKAYSSLGGEHAIETLEKLVTQLNPFNDPLKTFFRQAAFEALVYNRSERAEKLLVGLSTSWVMDIKRQAQSALKKRRELIFGGAHADKHSA